jgi:hypothetical protein
MSRTFDNIAKLGTAELATAEVVVLVKQGSPNFGIFAITARNRRNRYIFQVSELARQFCGITFNCRSSRVLKGKVFVLSRKFQNAATVSLNQCFPCAHLLKTPIDEAPRKPHTNTQQQLASRD